MAAMVDNPNVAAAMSFVRAVEKMDGGEMEGYFAPTIQQIEMPNAYKPDGATRDLAALKADIEKAKGLIEEQRYDVLNTIAEGDRVVLEMVWHGVVATDLPPLKRGQKMRAQCIAVFEFDNGKVIRLRNYDCFDPI